MTTKQNKPNTKEMKKLGMTQKEYKEFKEYEKQWEFTEVKAVKKKRLDANNNFTMPLVGIKGNEGLSLKHFIYKEYKKGKEKMVQYYQIICVVYAGKWNFTAIIPLRNFLLRVIKKQTKKDRKDFEEEFEEFLDPNKNPEIYFLAEPKEEPKKKHSLLNLPKGVKGKINS